MDLQQLKASELHDGCRDGAFYLVGHDVSIEDALETARVLFALPMDDKRALSQERSPAFRGWSEMHGARDCREQIHFGAERSTPTGEDWQRLEGPNQWPSALGASWRQRVLGLIQQLNAIGQTLLGALSVPIAEEPYLLLKMIRYPPSDQVGVAPHCDFSWLTLVIQERPGLAVRDRAGRWHDAPPREGALFVDIGELLEWRTHGEFRAAPHRVDNRSSQGRISLPLFVNPALSDAVNGSGSAQPEEEHVHRVLPPSMPPDALHFGRAEWRRKGLNRWCYACSG